MRRCLPLAFFVAAVVVAPRARASDPKPNQKPDPAAEATAALKKAAEVRLERLIKTGGEQCERGEVDEGIAALTSALAQKPDAAVATTLAGCEVTAKRWAHATEHLAFALRATEEGPERLRLEEMFLDARKRVGGVKVTVNIEGADVFVSDRRDEARRDEERYVGQSPIPGEVYVEVGRSLIVAKKPTYDEAQRYVDIKAPGDTVSIALELSPTSSTGGRYVVRARTRVPFFVLGSLGLVAGGIGGALFASATSKASAADDLLAEMKGSANLAPCRADATGCTTVQSLRQGHDTAQNIGTGLLVGGGVLLATATLYGIWAFQGPAPTRTGSISIAPALSPQGGGLRLEGTF